MIRTKAVRKKPRITVASAKDKCRWLQNWVAARIAELTGLTHGKDEDIEGRPMGQSGCDVILRGPALEQFPFSIECKSGESISWTGAVRQVKKNRRPNTDWLVFLKNKQTQHPFVLLDAVVFFRLLQKK